MEKDTFLSVAVEAVKKSEEIIRHYYQSEVRVTLKEDQSPVTIADQEAEKLIKAEITSNFPDHSFLGEEEGYTGKKSEYTWIIDPIDGTKNYLRKIPLFATQVALMKNDSIILGISNAPILHELMYAERGRGVFLNDKKVHVSSITNLKQSYLCYGGLKYFQKNNILNNLLSLTQNLQGNRGIGDFWCYHLLAQGKIDIMIEAQTKIWDIAALSLIVEEAGGRVTDIKGNVINKDTTSLIATNNYLHDHVLQYFRDNKNENLCCALK